MNIIITSGCLNKLLVSNISVLFKSMFKFVTFNRVFFIMLLMISLSNFHFNFLRSLYSMIFIEMVLSFKFKVRRISSCWGHGCISNRLSLVSVSFKAFSLSDV